MEQIKIQKEFWDKMVSDEKQYEFRKLEKGLISGTYEFVSIELGKELFDSGEIRLGRPLMVKRPKEIFGTAHLKPIAINPELCRYVNGANIMRYAFKNILSTLSKETYHFVKENYIDKGIDFMVYEISDVKEGE